ncbi:hypothetical protein DL96DRAFT_1635990, partial [Flagelloscypha sp. PMI_526]
MRGSPSHSGYSPLQTDNPPPYLAVYNDQPGRSHGRNPSPTNSQPRFPVNHRSETLRESNSASGFIVFGLLVVAFMAGYWYRGSDYPEWMQEADLRWIDLTPEKKCMSYEKRMYTAKLAHVPGYTSGDKWCWNVPITIHEDVYDRPVWCGVSQCGLWSFLFLSPQLSSLSAIIDEGRPSLWPVVC